MGLFKIVNATEVQTKMALPSIEAALPVIDSAIESAHLRMEAELGTRFDSGSVVEQFNCDPTIHNLVPDGFFRLRLSRCFLKAGTEVTCAGEDITSSCTIRTERGFVFVPEDLASGKVVTVTYDYGFDTGDTPPDWLKEAVLSYVPAAFYMGNPDVRDDASAAGVIEKAAAHALAVISLHTRTMNFSLSPIFPLD